MKDKQRSIDRPPGRHRCAFTLIEMVLTLTASSTLMVLAVSLISQSMSIARTAEERVDQVRTTTRLARQFREDVHAAISIEDSADDLLVFRSTDQSRVTYRIASHQIVRESQPVERDQSISSYASSQSSSSRSTDNNRRQFERYELADNTSAAFEMLSGPERIELTLMRGQPETSAVRRMDLRLVALVGKWRRLETEGQAP